jgi:hypothetical protein
VSTPAEIAAVRKVLYDRKRTKAIFAHVSSIEKLMNLDPKVTLPPGDTRKPGSGPSWWAPDGKLDPSVVKAAAHCDGVAKLLLAARGDLARVSVNPSDRKRLSAGLAELAAAWKARAAAWRSPGRPDAARLASGIGAHERASQRAFQSVKQYLENVAPGGH